MDRQVNNETHIKKMAKSLHVHLQCTCNAYDMPYVFMSESVARVLTRCLLPVHVGPIYAYQRRL